jgi:hypothetical protein
MEERTEPEDFEAKGTDLRSVGISTADIDSDLEAAEEIENQPEGEEAMAPEVTAPVSQSQPAPGPTAAPPPA